MRWTSGLYISLFEDGVGGDIIDNVSSKYELTLSSVFHGYSFLLILFDTDEAFYYRIPKNVLKIVRMVYYCWFALLSKPAIVLFFFSRCYFAEYVKEMYYLCMPHVQDDYLSCLNQQQQQQQLQQQRMLLVKLRTLDKGEQEGIQKSYQVNNSNEFSAIRHKYGVWSVQRHCIRIVRLCEQSLYDLLLRTRCNSSWKNRINKKALRHFCYFFIPLRSKYRYDLSRPLQIVW